MGRRSSRRLTACVLVASVLLAACGSGGKKATTTTTAQPTTTVPGVGPVAPLTGLPESDQAKRDRPLLAVKIDNHPQARPQFGLEHADSIVEEKVEGGLTRLLALFQTDDADRLGPVRSLRSTDVAWLKPQGGMIAYSGGIDPVKKMVKPAGITDLGADSYGVKYYKRRSDRPYEHSMYTMTNVLRELTPKGAGPAKQMYQYVLPGQSFGGAGVVPVSGISARMSGMPTAASFDWAWDGGSKTFKRSTDGKAHEIEGVGQISMTNVVLQFVPYRATPWTDAAKSPVDEAVVTGSGEAWFLSNGQLVKGRWSRPNDSDMTTYTDSSGAVMKLQPGKTWMTLIPEGTSVGVR